MEKSEAVKTEPDYVNYHNEHEDFNESLDGKSIRKNNKSIIINIVLICTVILVFFVFTVLNIDIFQPLGLFGEILRGIVAGLMIGYLILFFYMCR